MATSRIRKFLFISSIALCVSAGRDEFQLMNTEQIGALKIGLSRSQALKHLDAAPKAGALKQWAADGNYHQELNFPKLGVSLYLVSREKNSPQTVESITVTAPCTLATKLGIHLGSSEQDVTKAYKNHWNKEDSTAGSIFVAGSTFGGLSFQFKKGKVSRIFLGAASE